MGSSINAFCKISACGGDDGESSRGDMADNILAMPEVRVLVSKTVCLH